MKYLTDSQTSQKFVDALRLLGFDIETVYEHGIDTEKNDARVAAWARAHDAVFVTFDELRNVSGKEVFREVRDRGGKVLKIHGGPEQPPERAIGRFLFWSPEWIPDLMSGDGIGYISDLKNHWRWIPRNELQRHEPDIWVARDADPHYFERYLIEQEARKLEPVKKPPIRKTPNRRQGSLNLPDDGSTQGVSKG